MRFHCRTRLVHLEVTRLQTGNFTTGRGDRSLLVKQWWVLTKLFVFSSQFVLVSEHVSPYSIFNSLGVAGNINYPENATCLEVKANCETTSLPSVFFVFFAQKFLFWIKLNPTITSCSKYPKFTPSNYDESNFPQQGEVAKYEPQNHLQLITIYGVNKLPRKLWNFPWSLANNSLTIRKCGCPISVPTFKFEKARKWCFLWLYVFGECLLSYVNLYGAQKHSENVKEFRWVILSSRHRTKIWVFCVSGTF